MGSRIKTKGEVIQNALQKLETMKINGELNNLSENYDYVFVDLENIRNYQDGKSKIYYINIFHIVEALKTNKCVKDIVIQNLITYICKMLEKVSNIPIIVKTSQLIYGVTNKNYLHYFLFLYSRRRCCFCE